MSASRLLCNPSSLVHSLESRKSTPKKSPIKHLAKPNNPSKHSNLQMIIKTNQKRLANQENEIQFLKSRMNFLSNENQILRTQNNHQEKELLNIDRKDINISTLLDQHEAEILVLKTQLRKAKLALTQEQDRHKESESELRKLRITLYKTSEIISNKGLLEKVDLRKQLDSALEKVASTKNLYEITQSKLNILEGNYRVEVMKCRKASKLYAQRCEELQAKICVLDLALKEKQKLLEIQNIYSKRFEMVKINKKHEEVPLCSNCSVKWKDSIPKGNFPSLEKEPKDSQNPNESTNFDQCKIVEDIRKILVEEIKIGKLSFVYKLSDSNLERPCFPIRPLKTDVHIDSPHIVYEFTESPKILKDVIGENNSLNKNDIKSSNLSNDKSLSKTQKNPENSLDDERDPSIISDFENRKLSKLSTKSKPISQDEPNLNVENRNTDLKYMYPNGDSVVSADDWYDDLETISVFNPIIDIRSKSMQVENTKDKNDFLNAKILGKHGTIPHFMLKLPKTVIEDLKNKTSLIDKPYTNKIKDQSQRWTCASSINPRNVNFKLPIHKFSKCDRLNQPSS